MVWLWRYEDADGRSLDRTSETFPSQSDAETWLGTGWQELLDSGVTQVSLLSDDAVEYTMSLTPAG